MQLAVSYRYQRFPVFSERFADRILTGRQRPHHLYICPVHILMDILCIYLIESGESGNRVGMQIINSRRILGQSPVYQLFRILVRAEPDGWGKAAETVLYCFDCFKIHFYLKADNQ